MWLIDTDSIPSQKTGNTTSSLPISVCGIHDFHTERKLITIMLTQKMDYYHAYTENLEHLMTDRFSSSLLLFSGGHGGSIGRASASRSNGFHDQRFESRPEHKKNL